MLSTATKLSAKARALIILCASLFLVISSLKLWSEGPSSLHNLLHSHYDRLRLYLFSSSPGSPSYPSCVMYDKTPRTGSTTILNALRKCWGLTNRYRLVTQKRKKDGKKLSFVERSLCCNHSHYAIAGNHFLISKRDVGLIQQKCSQLFYVTSTREMRGRIISKAKYELSKAKVEINTTLSQSVMEKALHRAVKHAVSTERRLENYPFRRKAYIRPDYIIRYQFLVKDLSALLNVFNCSTNFGSKNVHSFLPQQEAEHDESGNVDDDDDDDDDEEEEEEEDGGEDNESDEEAAEDLAQNWRIESETFNFDSIPLKMNDKRHRAMTLLAQRYNDYGLRKAALFVRRVDTEGQPVDAGSPIDQ